jgi:tripartite-type tricarboxylate transporter receptor subunit TctC
MPDAVKNRLADAFSKMMATPDMQDAVRRLGMEPAYLGPNDFAKKWVDEQNHYKQVLTETGLLELVKSQVK